MPQNRGCLCRMGSSVEEVASSAQNMDGSEKGGYIESLRHRGRKGVERMEPESRTQSKCKALETSNPWLDPLSGDPKFLGLAASRRLETPAHRNPSVGSRGDRKVPEEQESDMERVEKGNKGEARAMDKAKAEHSKFQEQNRTHNNSIPLVEWAQPHPLTPPRCLSPFLDILHRPILFPAGIPVRRPVPLQAGTSDRLHHLEME
ncbi:hypothetical protein FA13DRAFT_1715891 [Coprinellus micaceus]|uniref:Uncharacterized protein n=1 Tax=Coprinellus micaceus TaxID=71717 RepID=A0A4Y7SLG1_COPMI|nr:hypothetical protein FA13DRAFT_1715891 [Coprinellus micaceus]